MKKYLYKLAAIAAIILPVASCTREATTDPNANSKLYLESWMAKNYPGVSPSETGLYIVEDIPGSGSEWTEDYPYVYVDYTIKSLNGTVASTNNVKLQKQLGTYNAAASYDPVVWSLGYSLSYAGVDELLSGMKIGGTRTGVIPAWLLTYYRYDSADEYYSTSVDASPAIYTVTLRDFTDDLKTYCTDKLDSWVHTNIDSSIDSTFYNNEDGDRLGFYFKSWEQPSDSIIPVGEDGYLLYIGRRLDGSVFDTNIADTAKVYGLWDASKTYEPVTISFKSTYTSIEMGGSSSLVDGFQAALFRMHAYEKASTFFYYGLGYQGTAQDLIPAYSSLRFDLELVDKQ